MTRHLLILATLFLCTSAAHGQASLAAPRFAVALTQDGLLRQIEGVPGACRFVPDADNTQYLALYAASHGWRYAVAYAAGILVRDPGSRFEFPAVVRAGAISPRGLFLALLTPDGIAIHDLARPDRDPQLTPAAALALSPDTVTLAVNDDGVVLLSDGTRTFALHGYSVVQSPFPLTLIRFAPAPHGDVAVAFSPRDHSFVLVHPNQLSTELLASDVDGVANPSGIEFSGDGLRVWISQGGPNSVLSISLETRSATSFQVPSPGAIRAIGVHDVFQWSESALLDVRAQQPLVLLVASEIQK